MSAPHSTLPACSTLVLSEWRGTHGRSLRPLQTRASTTGWSSDVTRRAPRTFHLANSSRSLLLQSRRPAAPFVVTVHDVVPRTRALLPVYRVLAYPQVTLLAAAVDRPLRLGGRHAAPPRGTAATARGAASSRSATRPCASGPTPDGHSDGPTTASSPSSRVRFAGSSSSREALAAVEGLPDWRIALAGRVADRRARAPGRTARRASFSPIPTTWTTGGRSSRPTAFSACDPAPSARPTGRCWTPSAQVVRSSPRRPARFRRSPARRATYCDRRGARDPGGPRRADR